MNRVNSCIVAFALPLAACSASDSGQSVPPPSPAAVSASASAPAPAPSPALDAALDAPVDAGAPEASVDAAAPLATAVEIDPKSYAYADEAMADPAFAGRGFPMDRHPRALLDIASVLGRPIRAEAGAGAATVATITKAGISGTAGCVFYSFAPSLAGLPTRPRCGDTAYTLAGAEGLRHWLFVYDRKAIGEALWVKVIADSAGALGWVRADSRAVRPIERALADGLASETSTWDRRLHRAIGKRGGSRPFRIRDRRSVAFDILETRIVKGRLWLRVKAKLDVCTEDVEKALGGGWVALTDASGRVNVWYELSC